MSSTHPFQTRTAYRKVALALIALIALLVAACGGDATSEGQEASGPVTVQMGIIPTYYTFMPHFVAEGLGLFDELEDEYGITMEMVSFQSGADETKALVSGQLDMASSMFTEAAIPMSQGEPLVLALVYWNGGVSSMLVSEEYQAQTLEELSQELDRPIRVGVTGFGSGTHVSALAQLNNLGIATDDYEIVPIGDIDAYFPSLAEGRVDAVEAGEPSAQSLIDEEIGRLLVNGWDADAVSQVFGDFQANGLHVRREFMEERPDAVQHIVDALLEALTFMRENIDDPEAILSVLPPEAQESLQGVNAEVLDRIASVLSEDGCPTVEAAKSVEEALKTAELIGETVEVDWTEYMTDEFLSGCG